MEILHVALDLLYSLDDLLFEDLLSVLEILYVLLTPPRHDLDLLNLVVSLLEQLVLDISGARLLTMVSASVGHVHIF